MIEYENLKLVNQKLFDKYILPSIKKEMFGIDELKKTN